MNRSIGLIIMNFAVAIYLFATGILALIGRTLRDLGGGEIRQAVTSLIGSGSVTDVLVIILGVLAIAAGIFILLKFFNVEIPINEIVLLILAITWVILIVMMDIIYPLQRGNINIWGWLISFGSHCMVLAGILLATERFGGN